MPPARLPAVPADLRRRLLAWYDAHRRTLPWRALPGAAADPWAVLVSEIMLQQTTVATVTPRFDPFLERFPTPAAMAAAPLDDVLHAWQGLGYYRRARGLHATAVALVENHRGGLPRVAAELEQLPGIGTYTAAAVAAIAFAEPVVPIDGNVARVLSRLVAHELPLTPAKSELRPVAAALAATERAGDFAQAIMELGALVCTPRRPECGRCPWSFACRALADGKAARLPARSPRADRPTRYAAAMLIRNRRAELCLRRRPPDGLLGGLIELPTSPLQDLPFDPTVPPATILPPADWRRFPGRVRHVFTHFAMEVVLVEGQPAEPLGNCFFHPIERLRELALPTLTRKLLAHAGITVDRGPA